MPFNPALPLPIKWSVGDNRFEDTQERFPKQLSMFVPTDSLHAFAQHLMNLADQQDRYKKGKVWNYAEKKEVEVDGIYINANGMEGAYGAYGNINPAKIEVGDNDFL